MTVSDANQKFPDLPGLALGTWAFGGDYWFDQNHSDSVKTLGAALRAGVRHFDTAPVYGKGRAETVTGQQLRRERDQMFIATKAMYQTGSDLSKSIDVSLKRLMTDRIDLFYIHWPKTGEDLRPMMEQLEQERQKGRILKIGASNMSVTDLESLSEVGTVDAVQNGYSLLFRQPEEELLPWCREKQIPFLGYSPLAQGILTGGWAETKRWDSRDRRKNLIFFEEGVWDKIVPGLRILETLAEEAGLTPGGVALQWLLHQEGVGVVVGARTRNQWESLIKGWNESLPENLMDRITELSSQWKIFIPRETNIFRHRC